MKFAALLIVLGLIGACSDDPAVQTPNTNNNGWDLGDDMANNIEDMSTEPDMAEPDMAEPDMAEPDMTEPDMEPDMDLCALVDCAAPENVCEEVNCNPATGQCEVTTREDGATCDDEDACTQNDVCTAGVCGGTALDCSGTATGACEVPICVNGACEVAAGPDGETCDFQSFCGWEDTCSAGACTEGYVGDCGLLNVFQRATASTLSSRGNDVAAFTDACPQGQVPMGFRAAFATSTFYDDNLTRFVTVCGEIQVNSGVVTVVEASDLPSRGVASSTATETRLCPTDQVVVGISGGIDGGPNSNYVSALIPKCAPLSVTGDAEIGYAFSIGTAADAPGLVGSAGTAFGPLDCPAGSVARGTFGTSGEVLDTVGLLCGELFATRVTTAPTNGNANTGGVSTLDCPAGQVPYSVTGRVSSGFWSGILTEFSLQCAQVVATDDGNGGWTLTRVDVGDTLPAQGSLGSWSTAASSETKTCPDDEFVVGLSVYARDRVDQVEIACAPLSVTGSPSTGFDVSYGAPSAADALGTNTSGTFSGPYMCPQGTAASGFFARHGEVLDALALRCSEPLVR
jgi:hypothetical protein